jgi:hypothetical protein
MTAALLAKQESTTGIPGASEGDPSTEGGHVSKPSLQVWIITVVCLLLPFPAVATICWTDAFDNQYSVELGSSRGGKVALQGYVKISPSAPCNLLGRIAPLFGTAVVVDANTAVIGWLIISIDQNAVIDQAGTKGCIGYREQLTLNLHSGKAVGEFFLDSTLPDRAFGPSELTLSACPSPQPQGDPNPLKRFDK